ncbi:MAG: amidohydrolase [Thermomicrobiales bacterium]|nr:amidohydrolase [Thermomicrobiales bacterium]
MPADLILINGAVITMDDARPGAEAVAIIGNRIARVGANADLREEIGPATPVIDLSGRTLLPGFNDNHTHPIYYGLGLSQIDARPATQPTLAGLLAAFRAAATEPTGSRGDWLLGRGYDDTRLDVLRHPTRHDLDAVTGGRPAWLVRTCGHLGVANSAALQLAGVSRVTPDPQGGEIARDAHGEPTGLLAETAMSLVSRHIPRVTRAGMKDALRAAGARFHAYGITSVGEASIRTSDEFAAYEELVAEGELPVRVFTMMLIDDTLDALAGLGMRTGWGNDWLRIGPAKFFQDGSGGGRTAAMFDEYVNDPGNRGITIYTQEELDDGFGRAHDAGFQLAAHAIGDRAITMILDAYEAALTRAPKADHRFRIEHCGMCTPEIIDRLARLQVIAVPQPNFIYELGDSYIRNFTPEQLALTYPGRTWHDHGIPTIGSSDVPVVDCNVLVNLRSAVTRLTATGQRMGPEQGVTIEEALRMFTRNGAYGSFEEHAKGTITPGKLADLVVLSGDPRAIPAEDLPTLSVDMTVVDGKVVYEA